MLRVMPDDGTVFYKVFRVIVEVYHHFHSASTIELRLVRLPCQKNYFRTISGRGCLRNGPLVTAVSDRREVAHLDFVNVFDR